MPNLNDTMKKLFVSGYPNLSYHLGVGPEPQNNLTDVMAEPVNPLSAGMVMNPKNAAKLFEILKGSSAAGDFEKALAFFTTKYPKMSKLISKYLPMGVQESGETGIYSPLTKTADIATGRPISEMIRSIGHETLHGVQDRTGLLQRMLEGDLPIGYKEFQARKAGDTARKTFEKFLELTK